MISLHKISATDRRVFGVVVSRIFASSFLVDDDFIVTVSQQVRYFVNTGM